MSMCKTLAATILAGTMLFAGSAAAADKAPSGTASSKDGKAMELVQEWDKVFPRSDKVEHRKVTFRTVTALSWRAICTCPGMPRASWRPWP